MNAASRRFADVAEAIRRSVLNSGLNQEDQLLLYVMNAGVILAEQTEGVFDQEVSDAVSEMLDDAYEHACSYQVHTFATTIN